MVVGGRRVRPQLPFHVVRFAPDVGDERARYRIKVSAVCRADAGIPTRRGGAVPVGPEVVRSIVKAGKPLGDSPYAYALRLVGAEAVADYLVRRRSGLVVRARAGQTPLRVRARVRARGLRMGF